MREVIVGIDLGTTNSEVAIIADGKATVISDNGKKILPSVVGLSSDGTLLVGESAKNQYALYPERTILSVKRKMGTSEKILLADKSFSPAEISSLILKRLKAIAEAHCQCPVTKAVITVPAYFSDAQRQATYEAGQLAGLEVLRIINEPTAAALAYSVDKQEDKNLLVYDLGGGTFDVSIVSIKDQVVEVKACTGNNHLGGDDFDAKIVEHIEAHLAQDGVKIDGLSLQARARIREAAEKAKMTLSDHPFAMIEEEYLLERDDNPYHLSLEISRDVYEDRIEPLIDETLQSVHQALKEAHLTADQIDEVLLVGGSTKTPIISKRLEFIFGKPSRQEIDPELCVAMGAAIQAAIISGEKVDTVLVDITPYTFGISYLGYVDHMPYPHMFKGIIQKNTPIPVTKSEVFSTTIDNQEMVDIRIYQGEDPDALNNIEIGHFEIKGLSKAPEGNPIIVNFKLDLDGMLKVSAIEKRTGLEKKITINHVISDDATDRMNESLERIEQICGFPTDSKVAEHTAIRQLVAKAEQLLDNVSPDDQEDIINLIAAIKDGMADNDEKALMANSEKLENMLAYLEDFAT